MLNAAITAMGYTLVAFAVVRTVNFQASIVWIARHGARWLGDAKMSDKDVWTDPVAPWRTYRGYNADGFPFTAGVKAYRLRLAAANDGNTYSPLRVLSARALMKVWPFPAFAACTSLLSVAVATLNPGDRSVILPFFLCQLIVVLTCFTVAVESVVAVQTLDSWANWYHRYPSPPSDDPTRSKETSLMIGTAIITFVCSAVLIYAAQAGFSAFADEPSLWNVATFAAVLSFPYAGNVAIPFAGVLLGAPLEASSLGVVLIVIVNVTWLAMLQLAFPIIRRIM